jgi:hypothetical protein
MVKSQSTLDQAKKTSIIWNFILEFKDPIKYGGIF